jgi:hypothetical protein
MYILSAGRAFFTRKNGDQGGANRRASIAENNCFLLLNETDGNIPVSPKNNAKIRTRKHDNPSLSLSFFDSVFNKMRRGIKAVKLKIVTSGVISIPKNLKTARTAKDIIIVSNEKNDKNLCFTFLDKLKVKYVSKTLDRIL